MTSETSMFVDVLQFISKTKVLRENLIALDDGTDIFSTEAKEGY